mgnify:CR=1 FL=1
MIDPDTRRAIYQLHLRGMSAREISRRLRVSRDAVAAIIRQQGVMPQTVRKDKIQIDPELLRRLYRDCDGWIHGPPDCDQPGELKNPISTPHRPASLTAHCRASSVNRSSQLPERTPKIPPRENLG